MQTTDQPQPSSSSDRATKKRGRDEEADDEDAPVVERIDFSPTSYLLVWSLPVDVRVSRVEFDALLRDKPAERGTVKIMGREVVVPRWQEAYGRPYRFSGVDHQPTRATPPLVTRLLEHIPRVVPQVTPNSALVIWYTDGTQYIGRHADDEGQIRTTVAGESFIVTVSLGAERTFRIRSRPEHAIVRDVVMRDNHAYVMCGRFQKEFTHEIVKVSGAKATTVGPRISVTLREFK